MGRAPCCEKMGLKKGPWTPEEDYVLINYIQQHGHANWRALPKQAGLLRCGKSCRLRWINYLRPDIKRGNFSEEEEDTIIKLHQMLGNRWSAIAAKLPGRTDNEIKNVWHTHLKKRLRNHYTSQDYSKRPFKNLNVDFAPCNKTDRTTMPSPASPEQSSTSELSSVTNSSIIKHEEMELSNDFLEIDESFWSEDPSLETLSVQCSEISVVNAEYSEIPRGGEELKFPIWAPQGIESVESWSENVDNGMDFWYNLFIRAGDIPELPEF